MQTTKVDTIVNGEVTRMEKFGAFVKIDRGVEGLVHISEIGWSRLGDPWTMVPQKYPIGSQWDGTVEKKENYGLFVNIAPGVTGLLPRSKWRDSMDPSHYENKKKGDKVKIQIDEILFEQKKISMGLPVDAEDNSWREHASGKPAKTTGFGNSSFSGLNDLLNKKK